MAGKLRLLAFLWLVIACHATEAPTATVPPTTAVSTATEAPTATVPPTTAVSSATEAPTATVPPTTAVSSATEAPTATVPPTTAVSSATEAPTATIPQTTAVSSATEAPTATIPQTTAVSSATEAPTATIPQTTAVSSATEAPTATIPQTTAVSSATEAPTATIPQTTAVSSATEAPTATIPQTTAVSSATEAPTATAGSTSSTTPPKPDACGEGTCGQGSTCQGRANETFICLCLPGASYNYDTKSCENAKVFPGQLTVNSITFVEDLKNKTSPQFKADAKTITDALEKAYSVRYGYTNSTVLEFRQSTAGSKFWTRSEPATASVEIFFTASSSVTTEEVETNMTENVLCETCGLGGGEFVQENLCDRKACDSTTASCTSTDGSFTCNCNENYIKTDFSDRICIACPSGKRAKDSIECENCPFGRSGFNCNETWQLTLVIVGSVLGALLLITLILLPVIALKPSKKKSKKSKNADSGDYVGPAPIKAPLVSNSQAPAVNGSAFGNAGVPRIPRATPTSGWESRTNLEMTQSNSRQTPTPVGRNPRSDDQDNMNPYAQSRQSSLYGQGRPQSNPYAQNRAQVNPYAQNQGHNNPYYVHDDGRRY